MSERTEVELVSGRDRCAAWLYLPSGAAPAPVLVMAHGLGGVRGMRLDAFAERFRAAGYACLVLDYRHFGDSGGEPRGLLDIGRQLEDWRAAVAHVRTLDAVDGDRVVLWGTSFSGGHVIVVAADDPRVAAVVAQGPFTDGPASALAVPPRTSVALTVRALRDKLAARRGRPRVMVPLAGAPGTVALMSAPDAAPGFAALVPPGGSGPTEVTAAIAWDLAFHRPGRRARDLSCPALFVVCEDDSVAPAGPTLRHVRRAPRGEVLTVRDGHFDLYVGDAFERVVTAQIEFLERTVPVGP